MSRKNYLRDIEPCKQQQHNKKGAGWRDYLAALVDFCQKPKTRFDLKDRGRFLILLVLVIILLQKVVQYFNN